TTRHTPLPPSLCLAVLSVSLHDTTTSEVYTLSLHDALPISTSARCGCSRTSRPMSSPSFAMEVARSVSSRLATRPSFWSIPRVRSEEHTSELQSRENLVCRLLLEKKKIENYTI